MSDVMAPIAKDDPLMVAWEGYKATDSYANTRKWAAYEEHVDGSLWAAFIAGYNESGAEAEQRADSERARADGLQRKLDTIAPLTCEECGPHVAIDEDGCCKACGRDVPDPGALAGEAAKAAAREGE